MTSREITEGEHIINNTFMDKVSLLLSSEFEPPKTPVVKHYVCIMDNMTDVSKEYEICVISFLAMYVHGVCMCVL